MRVAAAIPVACEASHRWCRGSSVRLHTTFIPFKLPLEAQVKKTFYFAATAALLLASTAAQAGGFSFEIDGQKIRVEAPRNCNSLSCLNVTSNGKNMNLKGNKASN